MSNHIETPYIYALHFYGYNISILLYTYIPMTLSILKPKY